MAGNELRNIDQHKRQMIEALERSLGIVAPAVKEVGISRAQHYYYMKKDPEYRKTVEHINELVIDYVEQQLFKQIQKGDIKAITFYLKNKARARGYTSQIDINFQDFRMAIPGVIDVKNLLEDNEEDNNNNSSSF